MPSHFPWSVLRNKICWRRQIHEAHLLQFCRLSNVQNIIFIIYFSKVLGLCNMWVVTLWAYELWRRVGWHYQSFVESILRIYPKDGGNRLLRKFGVSEQIAHLCKAALDVSLRNANRHKCNIISRTGYIVYLGVWVGREPYKVLVRKPAGKTPLPKSRRGWEDNKYYRADNARITEHPDAFAKPFLPWKCNKHYIFWVCVCSLRYPARNVHAPYCHPWPAPLYNIFPHYFINGRIFEKKSDWTQSVCFDFLYNFCLKHFSF